MFQCVVRHGYNDALEDSAEFEAQLIQNLKAFVQEENYCTKVEVNGSAMEHVERSNEREEHCSSNGIIAIGAEEELEFIDKALEKGVVHMLAEAEVVANPNSSIFNKIVVDYVYSFFHKNLGQGKNSMAITHKRLLKVGMTYEI